LFHFKLFNKFWGKSKSIDFKTIDFENLTFNQLNDLLKDLSAEMIFENRQITAEWESEQYFLKIMYNKEGKFVRLVHLKPKL
jgi:hypothetical protein